MNKIEEAVEHHQHYRQECNIENRFIFCHDNLQVLQGINTECIDLIYLDPPFNKKKIFAAPIGTHAEGASFKDIFTKEDVKDDWLKTIEEDHYAIHELLNAVKRIESRTSYNFCYLAYMAIRLIECHRVLKDTGSIYLHCDPTMSHYLKLLMDCIFRESNFINEITWRRTGKHSDRKGYGNEADTLLFYSKAKQFNFYKQEAQTRPSETAIKEKFRYKDSRGSYRIDRLDARKLIGRGYEYEYEGVFDLWRRPLESMLELEEEGLIHWTMKKGAKCRPYKKTYRTKETEKIALQNIWHDVTITAGENKDYPTQKPLALLERIVKASSKKGDIVLDPFCGCATTCVAAEKLERHWIGIDISIKAYDLVKERLKTEVYDQILLKGKEVGEAQSEYRAVKPPDINFSTGPPKRTDSGAYAIDAKYIYVISHPLYRNDYYKVGISSNPKSRLIGYQTSDPERSFKIEYQIRVAKYRELEEYIHATFPNKHEWVQGDLQEIIAEIEKNANKVDIIEREVDNET